MQAGDGRHQRQADAAAAALAAGQAVETLEDGRALGLGHAGAVVGHAQPRPFGSHAAADRDAPAVARVAHRIVQQVAQQGRQLVEIALDPRRRLPGHQRAAQALGVIGVLVHHMLDQHRQVERFGADRARHRIEPRHVEQLLGHARAAPHTLLQHLQRCLALGIAARMQGDVDVSLQHRQRRAQLVGGVAQEASLVGHRHVELHQQVVERGHQGPQLDRQRIHRQRGQVEVGAPQQRAFDDGQGTQRTVQRMQQQQRHQHQHCRHGGQRGQRLAIHLAVDRALQVGDLHRDQAVAVRDRVHAPGLAPRFERGEAVAEGGLEWRLRRGRRADHQPAVVAPDLDREVPRIVLHRGRQFQAGSERAVVDFLGRQGQQQAGAEGLQLAVPQAVLIAGGIGGDHADAADPAKGQRQGEHPAHPGADRIHAGADPRR